MTATWQPGDPLAPDNGCGPMVDVHMTPDERAAAISEGGPTPPWWRPGDGNTEHYPTRSCAPCGVRWTGETPCWACGQEPPT